MNKLNKFCSLFIAEINESVKVSKSSSWPIYSNDDLHSVRKTAKRRFSWENITKTKTSKITKLKLQCDRINFLYRSPQTTSPPKSKSTFKTSTPLKNANKTSPTNSPESNLSTISQPPISQTSIDKRTEPQLTTCGDRLGARKTSLNEFKMLLLTSTSQKSVTKPSAVQQLKLRQEAMKASPLKILDLSSSPKSLTNRRSLQQNHSSPSMQFKKNNLLSPKSRWKYNNFSKYSISSIPEVNGEDEIAASDVKPTEPVKLVENTKPEAIYATPKRNKGISVESTSNVDSNIEASNNNLDDVNTETSPKTGVIETNFSLKDNIFLQTEENNFMRGEIKPYGASVRVKSSQKTAPAAVNDEPADTIASRTLETSF